MTGGLVNAITGGRVGSMSGSTTSAMIRCTAGTMTGSAIPTGAVPNIGTVSNSTTNLTIQLSNTILILGSELSINLWRH